MDYYKLRITGEKKVWRKYFTYAERFFINEEETKFTVAYFKNIENSFTIEALNDKGIVLNESDFKKKKMAEFSVIERILFIKKSVLNRAVFTDIKGILFNEVNVRGKFSDSYLLLNFTTAVNCINESKSIKASFEFFSTLVLDKSKIPMEVDGFFLKDWDKYGGFFCIVNEKLKDTLLTLEKAKEFLIFDRIECE